MTILKCPSCQAEVEWKSNLDMERTHGWVWRTWAGEERLLCPGCSREGEPTYNEDSYERKGVRVNRRST